MLARRAAGFTLIEVLIALLVLGIVFMIGLPSLATWMQSTQVRTSAESIVSGLQVARAEALRRNRSIQFTLTNTLDSTCVASLTGTNWVVSQVAPDGACQVDPSETTAPQIVQKRSGADGSPNATVAAVGASSIVFNGLGRVVGAPAGGIQISIANSTGACQPPGGASILGGAATIRCLQVRVSSSGAVRMCDPAVTETTDPRYC